MRRFVLVVLSLAVVLPMFLGPPSPASAEQARPTFPTCGSFRTAKLSRLLGVGKLFLDSTQAHNTSCVYYGVDAARATKLATTSVPYTQISYYPSLMIAITPSRKSLFGLQLKLVKQTAAKQSLEFAAVDKKLRFTPEEYFFAGQVSGDGEPRCDPQIGYDNWVGPPECEGEPALRKVGVLAFVPTGGGAGRLVSVTATRQAPGALSLSHVLALAEQSVEGRLY